MRYIWINILLIALFVGTVNAQIQTPSPAEGVCIGYKVIKQPDYMQERLDTLEKRIAELEKIIKDHMDKSKIGGNWEVYFGGKCRPNEGILTDIPCYNKITVLDTKARESH